jgi:oligopeptide transport system ATP-binding protein
MSHSPAPLVEVRNLCQEFSAGRQGMWPWSPRRTLRAVDDISFHILRGQTLGLVGESGCGKSTTARSLLQLYRPTAGQVLFEGQDLTRLSENELRPLRTRMQIIFQDPFASLDPRTTVGFTIGEALWLHQGMRGRPLQERVSELLQAVGLSAEFADRYPHEFSGGQRQRIGIARALATNPEFIVADEPISSLDVSIQAQIINLIRSLKERFGLTLLFISHDLRVVRYISDRIAVMYLGQIVEEAATEDLFAQALHPYTRALLSAVPALDVLGGAKTRTLLQGEVPSPLNVPSGCRFHTRCPIARERCAQSVPEMTEVRFRHFAACFYCDS